MARQPAQPRYRLTHYPHPDTGTGQWGPDAGTWVLHGINPAADRYKAEIVACRCHQPKCRAWHAAKIRKVATAVDRHHTEHRAAATYWASHLLPEAGQWTPTGPAWAHDANLPLPDPDQFFPTTIDTRAAIALWLADPDTDPRQRQAMQHAWHIDEVNTMLDQAAADLAFREHRAAAALHEAHATHAKATATAEAAQLACTQAEHHGTTPHDLTRLRTTRGNAEAAQWAQAVTERVTDLERAREQLAAFTARRRANTAPALTAA